VYPNERALRVLQCEATLCECRRLAAALRFAAMTAHPRRSCRKRQTGARVLRMQACC
jgi:hypothetical protein